MEKYENLDSRKIYQLGHQLSESDPVRLHAMAEIMRHPMFSERELIEFFGDQPEALETIEAQRASSRLLALPTDQGYFYPRFQFDTEQAAIYEAVCEVNELIEAGPDPWGVASWWLGLHARLGAAPADLVGGRFSNHIVQAKDWEKTVKAAAKALFAPIG